MLDEDKTSAFELQAKPLDMPEVQIKTTLICPHCGAEGLENFAYVEDIQNMRDLESLSDGTLAIRSHYEVADDGDNPRLGCKNCDGECRIPDTLECEWR